MGIYVSMRRLRRWGREPSHVLSAMGLPRRSERNTALSSGFGSKLSDADETSNAIAFVVNSHNSTYIRLLNFY
jgi:hypothetical protein